MHMNTLLTRLVLLSMIRAVCLWMLPHGALLQCADGGLRLLTLLTLAEGAQRIWEGFLW